MNLEARRISIFPPQQLLLGVGSRTVPSRFRDLESTNRAQMLCAGIRPTTLLLLSIIPSKTIDSWSSNPHWTILYDKMQILSYDIRLPIPLSVSRYQLLNLNS
jgi:hypothetical protein